MILTVHRHCEYGTGLDQSPEILQERLQSDGNYRRHPGGVVRANRRAAKRGGFTDPVARGGEQRLSTLRAAAAGDGVLPGRGRAEEVA